MQQPTSHLEVGSESPGTNVRNRTAAGDGIPQATFHVRQGVLSNVPSLFGRLVYLAGCRDSLTERYTHAETAREFGPEDAHSALAALHVEVFADWLRLGLDEQMAELKLHIASLGAEQHIVVRLWTEARPFRDLAPPTAMEVERRLYLMDLEILMELLHHQRGLGPQHEDVEEIFISPEGVLCTRAGW